MPRGLLSYLNISIYLPHTYPMVAISDGWPDVADSLAASEPEYAERVLATVAEVRALSDDLLNYVATLRPGVSHCTIPERYTWGQSFVVFELLFDDGVSWIARFGMRPMDEYHNSEAQLARKINNEAAALHLVRERTTIPVPDIIAYCATRSPSHPLGPSAPPFVLMTAMAGMTLAECGVSLGDDDPPPDDPRQLTILTTFLHDIAAIHAQLCRITFPTIGSFMRAPDGAISIGPDADFGLGPFPSATAYFSTHADAYDHLASADPGDNDTQRLRKQFVAALWREAMLPRIDAADDAGPFPVGHGDLHVDNILVDTQGHVVGVLDWDCAGSMPWEKVAVPSYMVSGRFADAGDTQPETARLALHRAFRAALQQVPDMPRAPSGRTLAELHDSEAGQVGGYLAYWMYALQCDYEHTGRALHAMLGGTDIDHAFVEFVKEQSIEEKL